MVRRGENLPEVIYRKHSPLISSDPSPWVRQPARYLPLFLVLVCLSCIITAIDLRYGFRWLATGIGNLSGPVVHSIDLLIAPVSRSATFVQETLTARSENTGLRARIEELEGQVHTLQNADEENRRLRELLDLKAEAAPKAAAAEVLRYRNEASQRIMTLRAGKLEDLSLGQPVLTKGGQLLGRIISLTDRISTVRLITDPACYIGVTLEKTQSQGMLYSRDGKLFVRLERAELVPQNERVLTSHLSDLFPEGLLIGVVEGEADPIEKDPFVAAELGLMKSYRVSPVHPVEEWPRIREVLCLPLWTTTGTEPVTEVKP
jgi:cell shape-determining protein MreC